MALVTKKAETLKGVDGKDFTGYKFTIDDLATAEKEAFDRSGMSSALKKMKDQILMLTNPKEYAEKKLAFAEQLFAKSVDHYEDDVKVFYAATGNLEEAKRYAETKMRETQGFNAVLIETNFPNTDDAMKILTTHLAAAKSGYGSTAKIVLPTAAIPQ